MGWLVFSGEDGIDAIFDPEKNKSKKHRRDDALIPFKTKVDKNRYEDFSGVVGAFSRLMSNTSIKGGVDMKLLYSEMKAKLLTSFFMSQKIYTFQTASFFPLM